MGKRGIHTQRGDINRAIQISNNKLRQLADQINELQGWLAEERARPEPQPVPPPEPKPLTGYAAILTKHEARKNETKPATPLPQPTPPPQPQTPQQPTVKTDEQPLTGFAAILAKHEARNNATNPTTPPPQPTPPSQPTSEQPLTGYAAILAKRQANANGTHQSTPPQQSADADHQQPTFANIISDTITRQALGKPISEDDKELFSFLAYNNI